MILTAIYVSGTWPLSAQERRKIEVFEICGIRISDIVRNSLIGERWGASSLYWKDWRNACIVQMYKDKKKKKLYVGN